MATKPATRSTAKTAALPPRGSTLTKAQQAARSQGRPEPEPKQQRLERAEQREKEEWKDQQKERASVPATRPNAQPPADFGNQSQVPAFMRDHVGAGKENIDRADMEMPRLKLMQGLSKELEAYNDLRVGDFFHVAAEQNLGESFVGVPIFMDRRYLLWRPLESGGGILARADDGVNWSPSSGEFDVKLDRKDGGQTVKWRLAPTVQKSGLANWGTMNPDDPKLPPAATLMYNYLIAFPEIPDLMAAVLTFQRSSIKQGRRFNTKLKTTRVPMFGLKFRFTAFTDKNGAGQEFKNIQVTGAGVLEDERLFNQYREMYEGTRTAGLTIKDIESAQDDMPGDNAADDEGDKNSKHNKY